MPTWEDAAARHGGPCWCGSGRQAKHCHGGTDPGDPARAPAPPVPPVPPPSAATRPPRG